MNIFLAQYRRLFGSYLRPQRRRLLLLGTLLLGSIGLQLLGPQIIRHFIDAAQMGGTDRSLLLAALVFIAAGVGQRAIAIAAAYSGEQVGWTATNRLRADLARHCLGLDMSFHKRHTPGELIERIDGDATALGNFFSQLAIRVASNALLVIAILLLLLREDWRAGLAFTLYIAVALGALSAIQGLAVGRWSAERRARTEQQSFLEQHLTGMEDIRAAGAESYALSRLLTLMRELMHKNRAARLTSNLTFVISNFLLLSGYALGLALGAYLYSRGEVSIGTAYLIVAYLGMLAAPLENIREQVQDLQQATASVQRVERLFCTRRRLSEDGREALPPGPLSLSVAGVSFRYDDHSDIQPASDNHAQVLHNVSFQLAPGAALGLLGRTGSGKTTLAGLLFRLYDPSSGNIRLSEVDLRDAAPGEVRRRVAIVTQEVQIFRASVRDNLTFFARDVSDERLERALCEVGLEDWRRSLPDGLNTQLAGGGQGLSAGEAQLLAFARIFLKDPGLVILDEASSRLDPATEQRLGRAIERLLRNRTAIVIAHRLQTVQRMDDILILDDGEVVEHGPRRQLASNPQSRFYALLQTGLEETAA